MSKKSRAKKRNKQKIQKTFNSPVLIVETPKKTIESNSLVQVNKTGIDSKTVVDESTRKMISKDVKMIVFTLLGLILILIAVKILQQETGYISTFSDWLYKIANIQTR
jgi:hypothetical protein